MSENEVQQDDWPERRHYPRSAVLWSGYVTNSHRELDCVVLNISANGAKLRLSEPAANGDLITLFLGGFGAFVGHVVWCEAGTIGVTFLDDPDKVSEVVAQVLPRLRVPR